MLAQFSSADYLTGMKIRTRKFIGVFGGIIYLFLYSLVAMAVGAAFFIDSHGGVQFIYFVVAGVLWLPGMMAIIRWMSRPNN